MDLFTYYNPTKLIFGKGQMKELHSEVQQYGNKVLLVYGGGSIKKNGIYDQVMQELNTINAEVYELPGVEPNPKLSTVRTGAEICKEKNIDLILAVGGGSVIDCSKTISAAALYDGDPWDIVTGKVVPQEVVPLGTILTLAATGSEMNSGAVITNWETHEKYGWGSPLLYPKFSILDPENTYSVPRNQTVYGIVDMMTHLLEQYYFKSPNSPLQERLCEANLITIIETAPKLLEDLHQYEYRETIMYCGTMALNNMFRMGTKGDWGSHNLEHAISAVYDIPHGGGLAILFPNWMRHILDEGLSKTKQLAIRVFNVNPEGKSDEAIALEGIQHLRDFWNQIGAPSRLKDYQITDEKLDVMVDRAMARGAFGGFRTLEKDDVVEIYKMSM